MADSMDDHRAAPRYSVDAPVQGSIDGHDFAGRLQDISATGAAITGIPDAAFDNNQFVQLHMEGMGQQSGYVRRRIPEGFALQFNDTEHTEERQREVQEMIRRLGPGALRG